MKKVYTTLLLALFASTMAMATNYYISTMGSDSNNGRSRANAFATIAKAQSVVAAGDNVYILPGTSIAQTTLNISSSARQDNGDALAKHFQMEIEGEGFSLETDDEWKDFMWE